MATTKLLLLRDTLVIWGGEFGRRPCAQIADGREHTKLTYRHAGRDMRLTETNGYSGYGELKPAMLIADDDAAAKTKIASPCTGLGWHPVDVGPMSSALHLEHMTLLWVKMGRMQGKGAGFVWAMLER